MLVWVSMLFDFSLLFSIFWLHKKQLKLEKNLKNLKKFVNDLNREISKKI